MKHIKISSLLALFFISCAVKAQDENDKNKITELKQQAVESVSTVYYWTHSEKDVIDSYCNGVRDNLERAMVAHKVAPTAMQKLVKIDVNAVDPILLQNVDKCTTYNTTLFSNEAGRNMLKKAQDDTSQTTKALLIQILIKGGADKVAVVKKSNNVKNTSKKLSPLLESGINIEMMTRLNQIDKLNDLIAGGLNINRPTSAYNKMRVLEIAIAYDNLTFTQAALDNNADLNSIDDELASPLQLALINHRAHKYEIISKVAAAMEAENIEFIPTQEEKEKILADRKLVQIPLLKKSIK